MIFFDTAFLQVKTINFDIQIIIYVRFSRLSAKTVSCSPPGNTLNLVFPAAENEVPCIQILKLGVSC